MPVEIERKFSLPEGRRITTLGDEVRLGERRRHSLSATYFDTPDFALARHKITLRRRTGGSDAGWHLKLPGDGLARHEVHEPITRGASRLAVPAPLRALVAEVVGYAPLVPVVELRTRRVETDLTTPRGRRLALLCDDHVTAVRHGRERSWRELEVELAGGDEADLQRIADALLARGAEAKDAPSKLVQALGDDLRTATQRAAAKKKATAADVLTAYLAAQVGMIQGREAEVRLDAPDAVHRTRVATRRLRSTLRTFRDLLDAERTEPLRAELKWLAEQLGAPRDAEVLKARLLAAVADLPDAAVVGPVRTRLAAELDARHREAHAALLRTMGTRRYRLLMDDLVRLLAEPPFVADAERRAPKALGPLLDKARKRVTRLWDEAMDVEGDEREVLTHEARKKAKAARYGWEAATPAYERGSEAAGAWEQVTEVLGNAQDSVVARERLKELAAAAQRHGEPTFTYGVLWEREREQESAAVDEGDQAVKAARKVSRG